MDYTNVTVGGIDGLRAKPTGLTSDRHILYLHGGGYVLGSPLSHIGMAARLARRAAATVTVIDYRLAPEHPYPAAIDDCAAAYEGLLAETPAESICIAGDSAGGGATVATLARLRATGSPRPGCAYLISPWVDLTSSGESMTTRAEVDPMIDAAFVGEVAAQYAADTPFDHPGVSPLFEDLTGMPPMLIQVGDDEVLLSDSTRLAERARGAGVEVELEIADGMWHVYQAFARYLPEADKALDRAAIFISAHTRASAPTPLAAATQAAPSEAAASQAPVQ
jgi:acetyl esterase/lipase